MLTLWIVSFAGILAAVYGKSYEGYTVLTLAPDTDSELELLQTLRKFDNYGVGVDFWNEPTGLGMNVTVAVPPDVAEGLSHVLSFFNIDKSITIPDLQKIIDKQKEEIEKNAGKHSDTLNLLQYNEHKIINNHLDSLAKNRSECSVITIGTSYEGRPMKVMRINTTSQNKSKPGIWIDAGIHAREWIAPSVALHIIDKLLHAKDRGDKDGEIILNAFDWYILPSANPDGYEYSRTSDRMWRKTRSPNGHHRCVGTDPNRNWDFHWMETGASANPCADIYGGNEPFSEVETKSIADFLKQNKEKFYGFLTLHSYGQYWLTPWGYTSDTPDDYNELERVGFVAAEAIRKVHGTKFTVGSSTNVLYAAAGGSDDWAKGVAEIKYAYTVELRDHGFYGFLLPSNQIQDTADETWAGVKALAMEIRKKMILKQN